MYQCDICGKETNNPIFGRWVGYCQACKKEGEQKDFEHTSDEFANDIANGDFSNIDGETANIIAKHV